MVNRRILSRWRHVIPHLAALIVIITCVYLALWQWDRAEEKDTLLTEWDSASAVSLSAGAGDDERPGQFARVAAEGRFDREHAILLDNQLRNMHPGVHVFTPFRPHGSDRTWMVNRGWQPMPRRDHLPEFDTPAEPVRITGRLSDPPRVGIQIGRAESLDPDNWPNLMTYFDLERIRDVLGPEVQDKIILLDPDHPAHLSGDEWQPVVFGPERHRAYTFQWASIAVAVFIIWLTLTIRSYRQT